MRFGKHARYSGGLPIARAKRERRGGIAAPKPEKRGARAALKLE